MKVLLITREYPPHVKGGMYRIVDQMMKYSRSYGIDLTVIANHPTFLNTKASVKGVSMHRVPSLGSTFLTQIPSFGFFSSNLVRKLQIGMDLVYSNYSPVFCNVDCPFIVGFRATRYGEYQACKDGGKPLHAMLNRIYIGFDRLLVKKADGIISLSEAMNHEIVAMGGHKKPVEIIPNGIDLDVFRPFQVRQFNTREKMVLYVGRLDARKGLDILLYSFQKVIKKIKASLVFVGEGREKTGLINLANSLSLPVEFKGVVPNQKLPELYNRADLFVLPSLYEGMPTVALEAMACGTPTIVSDASPDIGVPRFEKSNVESLSKKMSEILASEKQLRDLSNKSLEISQHHSWDKIVGKTITYLRKFA